MVEHTLYKYLKINPIHNMSTMNVSSMPTCANCPNLTNAAHHTRCGVCFAANTGVKKHASHHTKRPYPKPTYHKCTICRYTFRGNPSHTTCKRCLNNATGSKVSSCDVCGESFTAYKKTKKKFFTTCITCESARKHLCIDCGIIHVNFSNPLPKCEGCKFKNIPCGVCGDIYSTTPDGPKKCNGCLSAFDSVYTNHKIHLVFEVRITVNESCIGGRAHTRFRSNGYGSEEEYMSDCSGNSDSFPHSDHVHKVCTETRPLTTLITKNDIMDSVGTINPECKYLQLYECSPVDTHWCDCRTYVVLHSASVVSTQCNLP